MTFTIRTLDPKSNPWKYWPAEANRDPGEFEWVRQRARVWFYPPCEHSTGGTGFAARSRRLEIGLQVVFMWDR